MSSRCAAQPPRWGQVRPSCPRATAGRPPHGRRARTPAGNARAVFGRCPAARLPRPPAGVEQIRSEQRRAVRVCLRLGPPGSGGPRVRQEAVPVRSGRPAEPAEAAFRHGEQLLKVRRRQSPTAGLGEHDRKGEGGLDTGAAGREVRARVPEGPRDASGLGSGPGELDTAEGAQGGDGEPGAEGKDHAGRPERLGGDRSAAPGDACREVDVGGVRRVSSEQGPEVLDGRTEQFARARVVAFGVGVGEEMAAGAAVARAGGGGGTGGRVVVDPEPDREGASGREFRLPAQHSGRREGVHGRRVGRDGDGPPVAVPAESGAVDARGEFGSCPAGRHRAQVREIRAQSEFHGEPEGAGDGAAQGDSFASVGAPRALDGEAGIGPGVSRDTEGTEEHGAVGGRHAALEGDGLAPRHPEDTAGQEAAPRRVHALGSLAGELSVVGADGECGQGHAEERAVNRGEFRGAWGARRRDRGAGTRRPPGGGTERMSGGAAGGRDGAEGHGGYGVLSVRTGRPAMCRRDGSDDSARELNASAGGRVTVVIGHSWCRAVRRGAASCSPAWRRRARRAAPRPSAGLPRRGPGGRASAGSAGCSAGGRCASGPGGTQRWLPVPRRSGRPAPSSGRSGATRGRVLRCRPGGAVGRRRTRGRRRGQDRGLPGRSARRRWTRPSSPRG